MGSGTRPSICIHPFDSSVCTRYHIRRRPGRRWSSEIERNRILRLQKRFDHKRTEFLSRLAGIISRGFERATIRLNSGLHVLENGDMYTNIYTYMGVYACRGMMQVWSCWSNESWKEWKRVEEARWLVVVLLSLSLLLLLMLLRHGRTIGPRSICTCGFVPRLASISRGHRPHDLVGLAILSIIWQSAASSTPRLPLLTASPRAKRLASPPRLHHFSGNHPRLAFARRPRLLLCRVVFLPPLLARPRSEGDRVVGRSNFSRS